MTIGNNDKFIKFYYYKFDLNMNNNTLILEKDYIPLTINNEKILGISRNVACELLNNKENDILTCFYSVVYPCQISITSFSVENENITEIPLYSKNISFSQQNYINLFGVKTIGDRSKAYISFVTYNFAGYSAIYDINLNELYSIEKRIGNPLIECDIRCMDLYYFERTEQFVLFFRDDGKTFRIVILNKEYEVIYNKNGTYPV